MYNSCDIDVINRHLNEITIERVFSIISYACDDRRSTMSACRPLTERGGVCVEEREGISELQ